MAHITLVSMSLSVCFSTCFSIIRGNGPRVTVLEGVRGVYLDPKSYTLKPKAKTPKPKS